MTLVLSSQVVACLHRPNSGLIDVEFSCSLAVSNVDSRFSNLEPGLIIIVLVFSASAFLWSLPRSLLLGKVELSLLNHSHVGPAILQCVVSSMAGLFVTK